MPNGSNHLKRCAAVIRFDDPTCTTMTLFEFYTFTEERYRKMSDYMSTLATLLEDFETRIDQNKREEIIQEYYDGLNEAEIALKFNLSLNDVQTVVRAEKSILEAISKGKTPYLQLRFSINNEFSAKARCWLTWHTAKILAKQFENSANKMRDNNIDCVLRKKIKRLIPVGQSITRPYRKPQSKKRPNSTMPF